MKLSQTTVAITLVVVTTLLFAIADTTMKLLGGVLPITLMLIARYGLQAIVATIWVARTRGRKGFLTKHPGFQLLRALVLLGNSALVIYCLQSIPLAEFTSIMMLAPLVITAFFSIKLNEAIGRLRWLLLCGAFLGTLLVIRPGSELFTPAILLPLVAMLGNASFSLLSSHLARSEDPYITQLYSGALSTLLILPLVLRQLDSLPAVFAQAGWLPFLLLLQMSLCGMIGHLTLLNAFRRVSAASLMPFTYAQIAFAVVLGWLIFHHTPDALSWLGMVTIATCGALTAWLNAHRAAKPVPAV